MSAYLQGVILNWNEMRGRERETEKHRNVERRGCKEQV